MSAKFAGFQFHQPLSPLGRGCLKSLLASGPRSRIASSTARTTFAFFLAHSRQPVRWAARLSMTPRQRGRCSTETRQADQRTYEWATDVLFEVRKQRSEAKQPLKVPISKVTVKTDAAAAALMPIVDADLKAALRVQAFETTVGEPREILVTGYEALS